MKLLRHILVNLLVLAALFYIVFYVILDFPTPKWATEGLEQTRQEFREAN